MVVRVTVLMAMVVMVVESGRCALTKPGSGCCGGRTEKGEFARLAVEKGAAKTITLHLYFFIIKSSRSLTSLQYIIYS